MESSRDPKADPDRHWSPKLMIGKTISHYRILEKLGSGGMGVVYKAQDTKLDRTVALKFLPPELTRDEQARKRFIHEAKAASALDHPNICTIHEIDETDEGQIFIAMACYRGEPLTEKLERGTLTPEEALRIATEVAQGLAKAHAQDIVHRDVKPGNVFIADDGQVKILDFGLAKLGGLTKLTREGSSVGTVAYMSPEQARGEEVDARTDVWSLGVMLYEMLTGRLPFSGDYEQAVVYGILNETPRPVRAVAPDVPHELERIVTRALAKDPAKRYQSIDEMLADLKSLEQKSVEEKILKPHRASSSGAQQPFLRRHLRLIGGIAVVIAAVIIALVVGLRVQVGPQREAIAEENSLMIMYFDNLTDAGDPQRLGEIVANLLITDLSESQYVHVVSSQRLYDILKLLGREGEKVIDRELASDAAERAGVKWMLTGSILQVEPELVITSQLVDVASGRAIASQKAQGKPGERVFSLVDELTKQIKGDLSLPVAAAKERDPVIADVTTHSPEAYRYYLEGRDLGYKRYDEEAAAAFRKALQYDSTFAMAYYGLSNVLRAPEGREMIAKAVSFSDRVSQREQLTIKAREAYLSQDYAKTESILKKLIKEDPKDKEALLIFGWVCRRQGRFEESEHYLKRAAEVDPLFKETYNMLAYTYSAAGNLEQSIWAINQYISLAPEEANPYDTRGDLYSYSGKVDEAIASYRKALEKKPDFFTSVYKLAFGYILKGDFAAAERYIEVLTSSDSKAWRSSGRYEMALIPVYKGKFSQALKILEDGVAADNMEREVVAATAFKHVLAALLYLEKKDCGAAIRESQRLVDMSVESQYSPVVKSRDFHVYILTSCGRLSEAEKLAEALRKDIESQDPTQIFRYWLARGTIELARGNPSAAIVSLQRSTREQIDPFAPLRFVLGKAYLETGRLGDAVTEFEGLLSRYDNAFQITCPLAIRAHYLLGTAYEKSGWTDKAVEQYEKFLKLWGNSDTKIDEVEDARKRLSRLKSTA